MSQQALSTESQQSGQLSNAQQPQQGIQFQQAGGTQASGQSQAQTGRLFPTQNYLDRNVRTTSIAALNQCLADITSVNMQCKSAHWNVRGPDFYQLHELFEDLVDELDDHIDMVAERATALGGQALGTAPVVAQQANVPQLQPTVSEEQSLLEQIATSLATLDATLYEQINRVSEQGDLDTADLLNEVSRDISKALWFVEAHLQGQGVGATQQQIQ